MENNTFVDKALANGEGVSITAAGGTTIFDDGDTFTGAANGSTVETIDDLVAYLNADTSYNTTDNMEIIAARDGARAN